jgi:hypothetical protein
MRERRRRLRQFGLFAHISRSSEANTVIDNFNALSMRLW